MITRFFLLFLLITNKINSEGFLAGTNVLAKNGYISIEKLKVDDIVWGWDFKRQKMVETKVIGITTFKYDKCRFLSFGINSMLFMAEDHKFFTPMHETDKWTIASELTDGDFLLCNHGKNNLQRILRVSDFEIVEADFYCLTTELHNYYVTRDNILVHNFVPIVTWVVGEGLKWAGLKLLGAAIASVVIVEVARRNGADVSGMNFKNIQTPNDNSWHHALNKPSHNFRGPNNDKDPKDWKDRIMNRILEAYTRGEIDWKNPDPQYITTAQHWERTAGDLVIKVIVNGGMLKFSDAWLLKK